MTTPTPSYRIPRRQGFEGSGAGAQAARTNEVEVAGKDNSRTERRSGEGESGRSGRPRCRARRRRGMRHASRISSNTTSRKVGKSGSTPCPCSGQNYRVSVPRLWLYESVSRWQAAMVMRARAALAMRARGSTSVPHTVAGAAFCGDEVRGRARRKSRSVHARAGDVCAMWVRDRPLERACGHAFTGYSCWWC